MINGVRPVLRTRTALVEGKMVVCDTAGEVTADEVEVCNAVDVIIVGDVVVSKHEYLSQGHPPIQFS